MKKTLAIIMIVLCVLCVSTVYATQTQTYEQESDTTEKTIDRVGGDTKEDFDRLSNKIVKNNSENKEEDNNAESVSKIVDINNREKKKLEDYKEAYGSDSYGVTAYVLSRIQIYSIPFCFLGIAISAIYQYVLGIRKLDTRDKGFAIMISIITLFVIAQVLPLIFAVVVKGWRG